MVALHWKGLVSRLPRLDPHRLRVARRISLFRLDIRDGVFRVGIVRACARFQPPGPDFFLSMRQLFQPVSRPLCGRPGGSLGTVSLSVLPPPALGGIPELAPQLFRTCEEAAPKKLLRRGLDLFFRGV